MTLVQKVGILLFSVALLVFLATLSMSSYMMTDVILKQQIQKPYHYQAIKTASADLLNKKFDSNFEFIKALNKSLTAAAKNQENNAKIVNWKATTIPEGVAEWDYRIGDIKDYRLNLTKASSVGYLKTHSMIFFFWSIILGIIGALLYILPKIKQIPGIKNNNIFYSPMHSRGWLGIIIGIFLIIFYITLYWFPEYLTNWIILVDPISRFMSGNHATQWFLYGFLYTLCVVIMGIRMIIKYRNNNYQIIRTLSIMFFQTAVAFIIPEILVRLNQPYFDFKNMWPLDYDFFFEWNIDTLRNSGALGTFMLFWGIALFLIGVPIFTYFFGKRWYCSWVCGCGGLAETLGDPYRQLSDKSLKAWKYERYIIHTVLVLAIVMTMMVLYTYFTGSAKILFLNSFDVRSWYGFFIASIFSGIVGTGFYPLMGNRVWCRFGCPLAAYLGLVQKYKSRFRITVNGGQCISCGNCSTYCEMGIDVRAYAQRGQDIVRSSCVGCGICSAVCPRGVLRLENVTADIDSRGEALRVIHINRDEVKILM